MEPNKNIDAEIFEYIKEIAAKMKNNRASVMVGAGFSKNAEAIVQTDKEFLDWNALGDVFFEKVNGRSPDHERYLNVLKLAEEVESAYGRTVLNQLIKDSLPDAEYVPSQLHEKLLSLNWKDVFTTNYDTLLERTQEKITDRHYNIVLNKEDLIYSTEPRIIKLHGSFPSTLPFVITEEDYRQYPKQSAIFVNTVQQTLIENVLCLIGFSGYDPNFLQWIGWIRDNLGKDIASKIYLVGVFDFSIAQLNLLNSRNIVVLNMSKCAGIDKNDHKVGLEMFLNTLSDLTKEKDASQWPSEQYHHIEFEKDNIEEKVCVVINEWREVRKCYPGWFVLPSERRNALLRNTESCDLAFMHIAKDRLEIKVALEFLYEYNWRMNKCLRPILRRELNTYEKVIFSFNPFTEDIYLSENDFKYEKSNSDWETYSYMWTELLLDLFRAYRENGEFDKLEKIADILEKIKSNLTKEQLAQFHCETVKKHMFQINIKETKAALESWPRDISLPNWEIKRAGILMELGDVSQAFKIISDELNYVRKGHAKEINYYKISIEACLKVLASYAKQALGIYDREFEIKTNAIYNPYNEIKLFEALLKEQPKTEYEKETFDLNKITRIMIASENKSYVEAFQFIRYFEEIGIPFNCNHVVFSKNAGIEAVRRITPYSLLWSLLLQVKIGDVKIVENIWTREVIANMTNKDVENIGEFCMSAIKDNLEFIDNSNRWKESNFQLGIAAIMPEILSRLCTRMSDEMKLQTLEILDIIYRSNNVMNFRNINYLANRLINSMSENMKIQCFDLLIKMYLYVPQNEMEKLELGNIFDEFTYQELSKKRFNKSSIENTTTDILLQLMEKNNGRNLAISRLSYLYKFGLLTDNEIELFKNNLWSKIDKDGFPEIPEFYSKSYLLDLPTPDNVDIQKLIKKYILALNIPKQENGIKIHSSGNTPLMLLELKWCTYNFDTKIGIKWNNNEIKTIINKILEAWNNDKKYLTSEENYGFSLDVKDIIYDKYHSLDNVLSQVLISNNLKIKDKKILTELAHELKEAGLPYMQLKILLGDDIDVFEEIYDTLCDIDNKKIISACDTIYTLARLNYDSYKDSLMCLFENLSFMIRIRRVQGLATIIYLMHNLIYRDLLPQSKVIVDNILFGLDSLINETNPKDNLLNCTINQCISLRAAATSLAYIMFRKYNDNTDICEHLLTWKELSNNLDEFSEIRNKWLDI